MNPDYTNNCYIDFPVKLKKYGEKYEKDARVHCVLRGKFQKIRAMYKNDEITFREKVSMLESGMSVLFMVIKYDDGLFYPANYFHQIENMEKPDDGCFSQLRKLAAAYLAEDLIMHPNVI